MKDNATKNAPTRKKKLLYWLTAAAVLLIVAAIVVGVVFSVAPWNANEPVGGITDSGEQLPPPDEGGQETPPPDEGNKEPDVNVNSQYEFISPIENVNVITAHVFWHNQTVDMYRLHQAVDFGAPAGTPVMAAVDGKVLSVEKEDRLCYATITIEHANGIKTVYKFVEPDENLVAGAQVSRGQVIATVAAAAGIENAEGDHLHFEVYKDGKITDPEEYLNLNSK